MGTPYAPAGFVAQFSVVTSRGVHPSRVVSPEIYTFWSCVPEGSTTLELYVERTASDGHNSRQRQVTIEFSRLKKS